MTPVAHDTFSHEALLYVGQDDLIARAVPFVRQGVLDGDAMMVVLAAATNRRLADALGDDAGHVTFAAMDEIGRNPGRIIPAWHDFVAGNPGRALRGIGEPIHAGRAPAELVECQLHESLLNVAFAGTERFRLLCPYDVEALAPEVVHEARCSHPVVLEEDALVESREYRGLDAVVAPFDAPLPPAPAPAALLSFDRASYRDVREFVVDVARDAGLTIERTDDLVLAVHELATNSIRHGGGRGVLRTWRDGADLVCEVRDQGRITDPLAGRRTPDLEVAGGRGLWLAHRLCDLVQVRSLPTGTVARLRMAAR